MKESKRKNVTSAATVYDKSKLANPEPVFVNVNGAQEWIQEMSPVLEFLNILRMLGTE
jgi:hypothetical protein